jgi:adenine phosphoribosyltransferase
VAAELAETQKTSNRSRIPDLLVELLCRVKIPAARLWHYVLLPGILFRDITTLLRDADGLRSLIDILSVKCAELKPDYIVGIESRGFIIGTPLAYKMGLGFVPVRKPKKLPAAVYSIDYELEYGSDRLEIHQDALPPGSRVLIVDDLIATGGTAAATGQLINKIDCELVGFAFAIELRDLGGRTKLPNVPIVTVVEY